MIDIFSDPNYDGGVGSETDLSSLYEEQLSNLRAAKQEQRIARDKAISLEEDFKYEIMSTDADYREKARLFLANGMIPPPNPENTYFDGLPLDVLIGKVLSGQSVDDIVSWVCEIKKMDKAEVGKTIRTRHPARYMKRMLNMAYSDERYVNLLTYLYLPKSSKILGMCKSPHAVLHRLQNIVSRVNEFKEMESEMTKREGEQTKIALLEMKFKRIDFDINELSEEFGKYKRGQERYLWLVKEYPNISDKEAAEVCGVTTRQIRRYRAQAKQE